MGTTNKFSESYAFSLFHNSYFPFDITFQNDFKSGKGTMDEYPKDNSKCNAVATFDLFLAWTGREKASDYYPPRVLPSIQYLQGSYKGHPFAMILPNNLCDKGPIITVFLTDDGQYIRCSLSSMELQSQTTTEATVKYQLEGYAAVMKLYKRSGCGWECNSWSNTSQSSIAKHRTRSRDQAWHSYL